MSLPWAHTGGKAGSQNEPGLGGGLTCTGPSQNFGAPSFDDKKLEVVAVFGSIQMAVSRVINLQHHRIAQVGAEDPAWCQEAFGARAEPGAVWLS